MKLSCDKATTLCDKNQYGEISFRERVQLILHVFLCKKCGLYAKQNSIMTRCYKKQQKLQEQNKHCLSDSEKECIEANLKEHK